MPAKNGAVWKTKSIWPEIRKTLSCCDKIVVFDLETTGLSSVNDRIIEIAAVKYAIDSTYTMKEIGTYHQYINPGFSLSPEITKLTGITDSNLELEPYEDEVFEDVKSFFDGCVLGGYNIVNFDCKFMSEYYGRMGTTFKYSGAVDCLKMARNLLCKGTDVENYKLETVGQYFGLEFQAHSAIEDARTTGKLLQLFLYEYTKNDAADCTDMPTGTICPTIDRIAFWEGFRGFSRIYVATNVGTIYYDIRSHCWGGKDIDIRELDMNYIEAQVFELLDIKSEDEFAKFRGCLNIA